MKTENTACVPEGRIFLTKKEKKRGERGACGQSIRNEILMPHRRLCRSVSRLVEICRFPPPLIHTPICSWQHIIAAQETPLAARFLAHMLSICVRKKKRNKKRVPVEMPPAVRFQFTYLESFALTAGQKLPRLNEPRERITLRKLGNLIPA